jgi:hypothetical protein
MTVTLVTDIPVTVSASGAQPTPPVVLRANLVASVAAQNPGYAADLPGALIEDIASTEVAGLAVCDSAVVETINSISPLSANEFMLLELGQIYGTTPGTPTNTSVLVVFSGPPGQVLSQGLILSDGTYQYVLQTGGIISSGDTSPSLLAVATQSGSWVVAPGSVTTITTSVPTTSPPITVTNPLTGIPGTGAETTSSYRARTLQAGQAVATGSQQLLKTALNNVSGVQVRLVSVRQIGSQWEVLCGGGDPYQVAYAIWASGVDIAALVGSSLLVTGITNANPGVVTTSLNHNYSTGQVVSITGIVGMTGLNNVPLSITVSSPTTFSVGVNTIGSGTWISGGVITPNLRNQSVSIQNYPDTYTIPYVIPPLQVVTGVVTWNTNSLSFVSPASISSLAGPALVSYVNTLYAGQPINVDVMISVFQQAVASILPGGLITKLVFVIALNGVLTSPTAGTVIIPGDPESYFNAVTGAFAVVQG